MTNKTLFEPYTLGALTLANRIVMSPLTRRRAGAGLATTEATQVVANPDLVERLRADAPLAALNPATLFGGGATGCIDDPTFAEANAQ